MRLALSIGSTEIGARYAKIRRAPEMRHDISSP